MHTIHPHIRYEVRPATHPEDVKAYDTDRLRRRFLIDNLFAPGMIHLVYSMHDRYIVGGAQPTDKPLALETIEPLKADYFLSRRELGIINVGGAGKVLVGDNDQYALGYKEALYVGSGQHCVSFVSEDPSRPACFYLNSAPAHASFPIRKVTKKEANVIAAGTVADANVRTINQLIIQPRVQTCQLQMGLTELQAGSVWNTMPAHTHSRRMEAYFYFEVPAGQAVCHFMGEPQETRHLWVGDRQAVISPEWSVHSGAGTCCYSFIWGMAGENLDYGDMDTVCPDGLK